MGTQPEYVTADGGNRNLVNQDEQLILDRVNRIPAVVAPGGAEDDSYTRGVFSRGRADDVAGS